MKPIPEALAEILPAFQPLGCEQVALAAAQERVLGAELSVRFDQPPFDNSAMDGYALRAADLAAAGGEQPVTLPVRGESRAGEEAPGELAPGSAMRIFTGAPLPAGADAVVMQEQAIRAGDQVSFAVTAEARQNVRHRAGDLSAGSALLSAGTRLGPGELGLLASQGYAAVPVRRRPLVAILSTGDELRDVSDPPRPGSIVNSNAYALAAQVREAGGQPWVLPNTPDDRELILARVREGLRADLFLSVGGVSVGEYDYMHEAFAAAGVSQQFWKVAIKPGKPLAFGVADGVPVLGLPGNPVSAMVTFEVFVRPGLRRMLGDPRPFRGTVEAALAEATRHRPGRTELARARLERGPEGWIARLHSRQGSGSLTSMVGIDALVVLPAEQAEFAAGERLKALLLHDRRGSEASPF